MAVEETRQLYDPQLTGSRTALLTSVDKLGAGLADQLRNYKGLDTSKYAPEIADQTALQKGLAAQAQGLGALVGPGMELPAGVQAGSIEIQMQSIVGSSVPISFNGTQWGADWTRLVRIYPQQDLHYDQQYLVSLHNLHTINGETMETTGFIVHAPCQTPMSISCLELGVPKEASRKDSPTIAAEVKQSCTHIPSMTYWSWILVLAGFFCLRAEKT